MRERNRIKSKLSKLIEHETDMRSTLIFIKTGLNPTLKEKLTMRILNPEEDIKANSVFSKEEVICRTNL